MEITNNKTGVPLEHYRSVYRSLDPAAVSARTGSGFDGTCFSLTLLGRAVKVSFPEGKVEYTNDGASLDDVSSILLIRYLIEGARAAPRAKFMAYAEMPWGEAYLAPFTGRCIKRLAFGFGFDLKKFADRCEALGGVKAEGGDAAYDIPFLENLTLRLILWAGDDEFSPSAQILFSDNFQFAFTAEDLAYVGDVVINALKGR